MGSTMQSVADISAYVMMADGRRIRKNALARIIRLSSCLCKELSGSSLNPECPALHPIL